MIEPKQAPMERKPFNIDGNDTSGNQSDVPVTYLAGPGRVAMDPITPLYNLKSKDVDSGGKGGKSGGSGQKKWYADVAYLVCVCPNDQPVDQLSMLISNHAIAWQGNLVRGASDFYAPVTVPKLCTSSRFYWGRKDQPIDDLVLAPRGARPNTVGFNPRNPNTFTPDNGPGVINPVGGHYDQHSGYRNFAIWIFKGLALGSSPTYPNFECLINRSVKFFGTSFAPDGYGTNPLGHAYELAADPFVGAGVPDVELDQESWTVTALGVSDQNCVTKMTKQQSIRSIFGDLTKYYGGWFRRAGDLLQAGYFATGDVDISTIATFGSDQLTSEPNMKPDSLDETYNSFSISFLDKNHFYRPKSAKYVDGANKARVGEERPDPDAQPLQRPGIIDADRAQQFISDHGRSKASISASGPLEVKSEAAESIGPGDLCILDSDAYGLEYVLRIMNVERPDDQGGVTKLDVAQETGHWPEKYVQPPAPTDPDFKIESAVIVKQRIFETPAGLKSRYYDPPQVIVLAARPFVHLLGFNTYVSPDGLAYDKLGASSFAAYGEIATAYSAVTGITDTTLGLDVFLYGPDIEKVVAQTDQARDDNTLLGFIENEIVSVGMVSALGGGKFRLFLKRALYGTAQQSHGAGVVCWFAYRADLVSFSNQSFQPGKTLQFKLTSFTVGEEFPVGDVTPLPYTFKELRPYHVTGLELQGQGGKTDFVGSSPVFVWSDSMDLFGGTGGLVNDSLGASNLFIDAPVIFSYYIIRIRDAATGEIVFKGSGTNYRPPFTFSYETNALLKDGPRRSFYFGVSGVHRNADGTITESDFTEIKVNNAAPPALTGFRAFIDGISAHAIWDVANDLDLSGYELHRSTTPNFTPSGTRAGEGTCVYKGPGTQAIIQQEGGVTYYYKAAAYDRFGSAGLNWTAEIAVYQAVTYIQDLAPVSVSPSSCNFDTSLTAYASAGAGEEIRIGRGGLDAGPTSELWPSSGGAYTALTITDTVMLRIRAYKGNHVSPSIMMVYSKSTVVSSGGGSGSGATCGAVSIRPEAPNQYSLSCATPSSTIHYRIKAVSGTFGSWTTYSSGVVAVAAGETIYAYATATGFADGPIADQYNAPAAGSRVAKPVIMRTTANNFQITDATPGATIYYYREDDGGNALEGWTVFSGVSVFVHQGYTIYAYATASGIADSFIEFKYNGTTGGGGGDV